MPSVFQNLEASAALSAAAVAVRDVAAAADQKGVAAFALRHDTDAAVTDDGDLSMLHVDEEGRLKVSSKTASFVATSGNLTTSGASLAIDVRRASNIVLHVKNTGTAAMSAGAFAFEGSVDSTNGTDGTWFAIQVVRSNANTIEGATGTLSLAVGAGLAYSWEASVNACSWARVRCTTTVTASSIATWTIQRGSYATEPVPAVQTHGISGTVTVSGTATTTPANGSTYNAVTAASTNAAVVKASVGNLYEITVSNVTGTAIYVKLYNKASAPTVGTDVPVLTIPVSANSTVPIPFPPQGKRFATGIAIAVTGAIAASDTTNAAAGAQINATYI